MPWQQRSKTFIKIIATSIIGQTYAGELIWQKKISWPIKPKKAQTFKNLSLNWRFRPVVVSVSLGFVVRQRQKLE